MKSLRAVCCLSALLGSGGCGPSAPPPSTQAPRLGAVSVTCAPTSVVAGQSVQCSASATDQNGAPFPVSAFTWTSSDEAVARVDASGKATTRAVASGPVTLSASASAGDTTQSGAATVDVTPKAPTVHASPLAAPETWREADNPHLVRGQLSASSTLTLEPGVVVRFAPDAELRFSGGSLQAPGTAQAPIVLESEARAARGSWRGLVFPSADKASLLEHVTLSGCGGPGGEGACVAVSHQANPVLRDVAVRLSGGVGVGVADDGSAFGATSQRLVVTGAQGEAVRLGVNEAGSLPPGSSAQDNARNVVLLSGGVVSRTQTWPGGISYAIAGELQVQGSAEVTLTVGAGAQLRFGANARLVVGRELPQSVLQVDGTAEAPVLFTADSDTPQPGFWQGVHAYLNEVNAGRISHATFEYAGAPPPADGYYTTACNLNIYGSGSSKPFFALSDVVTRRGKGIGLCMNDEGFKEGSARVVSTENGTYPLTMNPDLLDSLPADIRLTGNARDMLLIAGGIGASQTLRKLEVPYLIEGIFLVGRSTKPVLTIEAGTEVRFKEGAAIVLGYQDGEPGVLIAKGTAAAPIRFIPEVAAATPGYWRGLHFWRSEGSVLDHVLITHGGSSTTRAVEGAIGVGNLNVHREQGGFVTNSTFLDALECSVSVSHGDLYGSISVTTQFLSPEFHNTAMDQGGGYQCYYGT
jgi:hypothetical protein